MKIMILTAIPFWHPGTKELMEELKKEGMHVEALDIFHGYKVDQSGEIQDLLKLPKLLRRLYLRFFRSRFVEKYINDEVLLDIHFVEAQYSKYLLQLPNKIICSLFGSDLYRSSKKQKEMQRPLLEKAQGIVLSKNMVKEFLKHFPNMESKFQFNQYGSKRIDLIIEHDAIHKEDFGKFRICIGYNSKKEQQHLKIIGALKEKQEELAKKIHLVFPLTYGGAQRNKEKIKAELEKSAFTYELITNRLSDEEICNLWESNDVCINMQTTDALASSIKESMVARNIMILADWLPYEIYDELGLAYHKANFENLTKVLDSVLSQYDSKFKETEVNPEIIRRFASWKYLSKDWVEMYQKVWTNGE